MSTNISRCERDIVLTRQGRAFNRPPEAGSVSAQVRSIANRNEALGLPPVAVDVPVYVTKDDAREAQHAESTVYGGQNPRGGMAAQMQVSIFASTVLDTD